MQQALDIGFAHDRTTGKEDWLTPPEILRRLGEFDLDPCSPIGRPWDTAKKHYTLMDNGLRQPWEGRVWLNPPYGNETPKWMERMAQHGNGVAFIFARTETASFFPWVWGHATAMLFLRGRVSFYTREGKRGGPAGAPSMLIAYGKANADALATSGIDGHLMHNAQVKPRARRRRDRRLEPLVGQQTALRSAPRIVVDASYLDRGRWPPHGPHCVRARPTETTPQVVPAPGQPKPRNGWVVKQCVMSAHRTIRHATLREQLTARGTRLTCS